MHTSIVTAPAEEPVTLTEAKAHLRVTSSDDDDYITSLIVSARQYAETVTRRALVTQTWDVYRDEFPCDASLPIYLPFPPLQSVTSVTYTDTNGDSQTWSSSLYQVDSFYEPARLMPAYGQVYPSTRAVLNAVKIRIVAGYGDAEDVPDAIKQAMLMYIGHLYEHREAFVVGIPVNAVPMATDMLLQPYRDLRF